MESSEVYEHSLPALDFEGPSVEVPGVEGGPEIAFSPPSDIVDTSEVQAMTSSLEEGRRQETSVPHPSMALFRAPEREESFSGGRLATASSIGRVGACLGQVAPATPAKLALPGSEGGCMGQEAPHPSPSASTKVASTALVGGGPGKATPGLPYSAAGGMSTPPTWRVGVEGVTGRVIPAPSTPGPHTAGGGSRPSLPPTTGASREEVIAFGGIPDPVSEGRRMSSRLLDHPEVDDMQQRCASRAAKLRGIEATTVMSVNLSNSIMHFSTDEIIHNANQVGISLGNNNAEISNSVNDLLDLEADRALETIRNLAAVRPMTDAEFDALGVRVLDTLCADLAPSCNEPDEEETNVEVEVLQPPLPGYEDWMVDNDKSKHKWKRKVYPASAVRRSARIRTAKKFHDEL